MRRRPWRGLALLAAATLVASGCNVSLQSLPKYGGVSGRSYPLNATFTNVLNLPAQAQVLAGTATVGSVSSITTRDFKAHVVMRIKSSVHLPVGTTAQVRFASPLGDEFVELQEPSGHHGGPYLAAGTVLNGPATSSAPTIEDAMAALSLVLNGGGINQIETIVTNLNQTFGGRQGKIRDLLTQISTAVSSLAGQKATIDHALSAVANLSQALNTGRGAIAEGLDTITPAVTVLSNENGDVDRLLTSVNQLSDIANKVLDRSSANLIGDIHKLVPVVDQLVSVDQQIQPDLSHLNTFERLTPKVAPGDYLQVSVNATAQLSSSPSAAVATPINGAGYQDQRSVTSLLAGGLP